MLYKSLLAFLFTVVIVYGEDDLAADSAGDDLLDVSSLASTAGPEGASAELYSTDIESFGDTASGEDAADIDVSGTESGDGSSSDESSDDGSSSVSDDASSADDGESSINDDDDEEPSSDGTGSNSDDASSEEEEDDCLGLTQNQCQEETDDDTGDAECGYNPETQECYSVVRRAGVHGTGNYDDGFIAAQEAAKEEANELYTVVGVLGGIIGALIIVIAGGGYYFYQKAQKINAETETLEMMDHSGSMGQSNYVNNDTSPMIVQQ